MTCENIKYQLSINNGNLKLVENLLKYLKNPYKNQIGISAYQTVPKENEKRYKTFCGT